MATQREITNMSSLKTAQALGKAGFDKRQAEAIAECVHEYSVLVSRQIAELGDSIRKELAEHRKETNQQIAEIRKENAGIRKEIAEIRKETADLKADMSKDMRHLALALSGMMLTAIGVMVALVIKLG